MVNTYYDPIYAANAAQDILNSASQTRGMKLNIHHTEDGYVTQAAYSVRPMGYLPPAVVVSSSLKMHPDGTTTTTIKKALLLLLQQQQQQHHHQYTDMNDMAEAILEELVPSHVILFGGRCPSIVENLP